jgi:hypothetical protein
MTKLRLYFLLHLKDGPVAGPSAGPVTLNFDLGSSDFLNTKMYKSMAKTRTITSAASITFGSMVSYTILI